MASAAACLNVYCKLSGLVTEVLTKTTSLYMCTSCVHITLTSQCALYRQTLTTTLQPGLQRLSVPTPNTVWSCLVQIGKSCTLDTAHCTLNTALHTGHFSWYSVQCPASPRCMFGSDWPVCKLAGAEHGQVPLPLRMPMMTWNYLSPRHWPVTVPFGYQPTCLFTRLERV